MSVYLTPLGLIFSSTMKKKLILFLGAFVSLTAEAQEPCVITGRLFHVEDGACIGLYSTDGRVMRQMETDTLETGRFSFTVDSLNSQVENFVLMGLSEGFPSTYLDVYAAAGDTVRIEGCNKLLRTWSVASKIPEQQWYNRFIDASRTLIDEQQEVMVKTRELWDRVDDPDLSEEMLKAYQDSIRENLNPMVDSLEMLIIRNDIAVMEQMPVNKVWMQQMNARSAFVSVVDSFPYTEDLKRLYERIPQDWLGTEAGKKVTAQLFPPKAVAVGDCVYDTDLYDLKGQVCHLSDFEGRYLLLDFWSAGCGPCLMAFPEMREVQEMWKDRLVVVSISSDSEKGWKEASERKGITWTNLNDMQGTVGIYAHYGIKGIPHYVIVSPEGRIMHVWRGYGTGVLKKKLEEWVK